MNMKAIFWIVFFLGIMSIGIYFLSKISTRKVNSFESDPENNLARFRIESNQNRQNHNPH